MPCYFNLNVVMNSSSDQKNHTSVCLLDCYYVEGIVLSDTRTFPTTKKNCVMTTFFEPDKLVIGETYLLINIVETNEVARGKYVLVSIEKWGSQPHPVVAFAKSANLSPQFYLTEAHAQFGDPAWRQCNPCRCEAKLNIYHPIGALSWNSSWVEISPSSKDDR